MAVTDGLAGSVDDQKGQVCISEAWFSKGSVGTKSVVPRWGLRAGATLPPGLAGTRAKPGQRTLLQGACSPDEEVARSHPETVSVPTPAQLSLQVSALPR